MKDIAGDGVRVHPEELDEEPDGGVEGKAEEEQLPVPLQVSRDVYKRSAFFVGQNVRQNDIVILSGFYPSSSFIEFYLKSDLNLPQISMISFRNSSYIEKLLESPLSVNVYAILHEEKDYAWNPNLYNMFSTDFQLLTTFTDKYSEETVIHVYQLLER